MVTTGRFDQYALIVFGTVKAINYYFAFILQVFYAKSLRFLVISRFCLIFLFANQWNTWYKYTWLLKPDKISHTQSMVAKTGRTNRANVHTPCVNKSCKTQHGRISIDPAVLAAIGHRFIAKNNKNSRRGSGATRMETKNRRLVFVGLRLVTSSQQLKLYLYGYKSDITISRFYPR